MRLTRCPRKSRRQRREPAAMHPSAALQRSLRRSHSSAAQLPSWSGVPCRPCGSPCSAPPRVCGRRQRASLCNLLHRSGVREPVQRRHDERAHQVHLRQQGGRQVSTRSSHRSEPCLARATHLHRRHVVQPDVGGAGAVQPPQAALNLAESHAAGAEQGTHDTSAHWMRTSGGRLRADPPAGRSAVAAGARPRATHQRMFSTRSYTRCRRSPKASPAYLNSATAISM